MSKPTPAGPPFVRVNAYDVGQDAAEWSVSDIADLLEGLSRSLPTKVIPEVLKRLDGRADRLLRP